MKLTIKDRFVLMQLLPQTGSFATIRAVDKTRRVLAPSDQEKTEYKILEQEGKVTWDSTADTTEKEIAIPAAGFDVLKDAMGKLDREEKIPSSWCETLEKLDELIQAPK